MDKVYVLPTATCNFIRVYSYKNYLKCKVKVMEERLILLVVGPTGHFVWFHKKCLGGLRQYVL